MARTMSVDYVEKYIKEDARKLGIRERITKHHKQLQIVFSKKFANKLRVMPIYKTLKIYKHMLRLTYQMSVAVKIQERRGQGKRDGYTRYPKFETVEKNKLRSTGENYYTIRLSLTIPERRALIRKIGFDGSNPYFYEEIKDWFIDVYMKANSNTGK